MSAVPFIPGAINVPAPLAGNEIVGLGLIGPMGGQTTTAAVAALATTGTNGGITLALTSGLTSAGVPLTATATGGAFGVSNTLGTASALTSEAANSSTVTDTVMWEVQLPALWDVTKVPILTVRGSYVLGSGTIGTNTLTAHAYGRFAGGNYTVDFMGTALPLPATNNAANKMEFTASAAPIGAGGTLIISLVLVLQDTGGSNITGKITNVSLSQ